jgi:hypothetical protein
MFREKFPFQTQEGKWQRVYGLSDGSAQIATSNDGNYDAWEKQHSPQPNQ